MQAGSHRVPARARARVADAAYQRRTDREIPMVILEPR